MNFKRNIFVVLIAVLVIFCIACVSAGDVNQTSVAANSDVQALEQVNEETLEVDENINVKQASEKQTLTMSDDGNSSVAGTGTVNTAKKPVKLSIKVKKSKGTVEIFLKKNKKPINKIKLKVKIFTGKKYKTIYLVTGKIKNTKYNGYCGFATNALKLGKHKVVITSANKKYSVSKTSSLKVTKDMKKVQSILLIVSKGKLYQYRGF